MKPHFHLIPRQQENAYLSRHHILPNLGTVWHYHPEIELHYIIRGKGVRFVGDSISNFNEGELLLLGENLPHMWRCNEEYFRQDPNISAEAIVVQFLPDFMGKDFLIKWESAPIRDLYERAKAGLVINGYAKRKIISLMERSVNTEGISSLILILSMLEILCYTEEMTPIANNYSNYHVNEEEADRLNKVIAYTLSNYRNEISLKDISEVANLSITSFCRYFKMMTKKTFFQFLIEIRISHAKRMLMEDKSLTTEAICYECGFNNRSNFFRHFKSLTGFTPFEYKMMYHNNLGLLNNSTGRKNH